MKNYLTLKPEVRNILIIVVAAAAVLSIIIFASTRQSSKKINSIEVQIDDQDGDFFTDRLEVTNLINGGDEQVILGMSVDDLDLKVLEERVETNPFVRDAQVYKDVKGNLVVKVEQAKPLARILVPNAPDQYIDIDGRILPTSSRHTARVPVIEMTQRINWEKNITESDYGVKLLELLRFIADDPFWKAQIAEVIIKRDGELVMLPQVTRQEIRFGMPDEIEEKFKKLRVFYKEILPNKGWNTYSMVNLKFKNQIVCE